MAAEGSNNSIRRLTVAVIAVEPSGDLQGGALVRALKARDADLRFVGVGGPVMAEAGVELWLDTTNLGIIGPGEALLRLPGYLLKYWKICRCIQAERPDLTVMIDSPAVNMRLSRVLRRAGLKSVYYFPPSAWTKSERRLREIHSCCDAIICAFKENADRYGALGLKVEYFGHPMADLPELNLTRGQAQQRLGLSGKFIGILPGSRCQEVRHLLPVFWQTLLLLRRDNPNLQAIIPCATEELRAQIVGMLPPNDFVHIVSGHSRLVMLASEALLMSSGTASLEAAVLRTPMVLAYRFGIFNSCLGKFLLFTRILKIDHIGLPSLILKRRIVPEFIQEKASPENLAATLRPLLREDSPERRQMLADLQEVRDCIGGPGTVERIAAFVDAKVREFGSTPKSADIIITVNSPGEVSSWVKLTAEYLKTEYDKDLRIVVALVPCPYASGAEAEVLNSFEDVDLVLRPEQTVRLVLGLSVKEYRPRPKGAVVFLGGEPLYAVLLARRFRFYSVGYAVRSNIAWRWFTRVCTDTSALAGHLEAKGLKGVKCIGNLCIERVAIEIKEQSASRAEGIKCVGIFPGSRFLHVKAALGPFLRLAARLKSLEPKTRFILSVSPFISERRFMSALLRPLPLGFQTACGRIEGDKLIVECKEEAPGSGASFQIDLVWGRPYEVMSRIDMALTIPGTNNGELAFCGIPMVAALSNVVPFPRGGLGGIIDKLPGFESLKRYMRTRSYRSYRFASQPNRIAERQVVPEIVVKDDMFELIEPLLRWLRDEEARLAVSRDLKAVMGASDGAARKMAEAIADLVK